MPIVGTAGHVDHGKSTLIEALTGRDPDRWAEEKRRGLTIDLGFAWVDIGDVDVGFVDVPGHERFVKNMLAGVGAVDVALLVVAADEGWMPQTEEHAAVLDLLDVAAGVIALTRTDLVDAEMVTLATAEVADRVAGTTLADWPVVPVSALTGDGMDRIRDSLEQALRLARPAAHTDPPTGRSAPARLWVDRSFSVDGVGLVVTGTMLDGAFRRGETLVTGPGGHAVRIRGMQSHEQDVDEVSSGTRTALNLTGAGTAEIGRGTMLAPAGTNTETRRFLADLRPVRSWPDAVSARGANHLHLGTGHWAVRVRLLGQTTLGHPGPAVLTTQTPVPLRMGDRFILRESGRRAVVGGGVVLDPGPADRNPSPTVEVLRRALDGGPTARAAALLEVRGHARVADLAAATGGGAVEDTVEYAGLVVGDVAMTLTHAERLTAQIREAAIRYHAAHPHRTGIPKATLASTTGIDVEIVDVLVTRSPDLVDENTTVRVGDFAPRWTDADQMAWDGAADTLRRSGLAVPRLSTLGLEREVLHTVTRNGWLVQVDDDLAYLPEQLDTLITRLGDLPDGFTIAQLRDTLGVSRRQAVPVAEWLDATGWTSRRGDVRVLRRLPPGPAGDARPL